MSYKLVLLTLLCVFGIAIGQILFKKAAIQLPGDAHFFDWVNNIWLISAFVLYGLTTLLWVWILRHAPLSLAYPFMAFAFILVPVMSFLILKESVELRTFIGSVLIIIGVTLTSTT